VTVRAAEYVRMSTEHQQYSTENQSDVIREYARKRGYEIVRTFTDAGKSGLRIDGRDALKSLIDTVQTGKADFTAVLVYDVSRWGRFQDADESAYYEYICKRAGIHVIYCAEQFENDGSPVSTIVKGVKRAMAGEYSRELSAKVFKGQCRLIELGFRQGGPAGYGLRRMLIDQSGAPKSVLAIGEQKSIQTDRVVLVPGPEEERAVVRRIYDAYLALVEHMKARGYLFESGGLLSMGQAAERAFGKKNFLELYAVFSSPVLYRVETETRRELGSLEQAFVDRLVEEMSSFLLAGRAWLVVAVDHKERLVRVKPAPRGKKPSWGGFVPQFLGRDVCQEMRAVLAGEAEYDFLDAKAKSSLGDWREQLGPLLRRSGDAMQFDGDTLTWWTFAGGRINQTLKYALECKAGWRVTPDNFALRMEGAGVGFREAERILADLRRPEAWQAAEFRRGLLARVPDYRLSKFQNVLPDPLQLEMVGRYFLDLSGTESFFTKGS
jgi:DNA invertase Pin-like site-specific DNA recombinase